MGEEMLGRLPRMERISIWISLGLLVGAPGASADDVAGQITASTGVIEGGEQGALGEGEHVNLGDDGGCSILVDEDSLVELCGDTSLVLRKEKDRRVVTLDRGEIRLVVEPRAFDKRVEIHTPAAIATLLGTIVHVSVDAAGITTISSAESKISIRSSDPEVRGTTVIDTSEQVTVAVGEAPPAIALRLEPEQIASLGGCLIDFHSAALGRDVAAHSLEVTERLVLLDGSAYDERSATGTQKSSDNRLSNNPIEGDPIASPQGICNTTDCSPDSMDPGQSGQSMYSGRSF
jgi:hypothetical protein